MKLCDQLNLPFTCPAFIMQNGFHSEADAAYSVFGPTVTVLMCWYHLIYNVKKHESLKKVSKEVMEMVLVDLTRLHYCLIYEFEPYFTVCSHLVAACDLCLQELPGYTKKKSLLSGKGGVERKLP